MSLAKAVSAVCDEMEAYARTAARTTDDLVQLKIFCKMLRVAVTAHEGSEGNAAHLLSIMKSIAPDVAISSGVPGESNQMRAARIEEDLGLAIVLVEGGSHDGVHSPINPKMPPGAFTELDGEVYELIEVEKVDETSGSTRQVRRLKFNEEATAVRVKKMQEAGIEPRKPKAQPPSKQKASEANSGGGGIVLG